MAYQQTVELATDTETGESIAASELLSLPEVEFTAMRRAAMANRIARRRGDSQRKFVCALCDAPVYLSRRNQDKGNRWFVHDGASPDCPWFEGNRLSAEMQRALIYRGQQEGEAHKELKEVVATWLEREDGVTDVNRERVTHGQVLKGEWKRPDVQCVKDGKRVVFEIQLSYTFLSEVIKRDDFYRQEGIFIIWLFSFLDLSRSTVRDEAFFNRRNVFILDPTAILECERVGRLTFNGMFQRPSVFNGSIEDTWERKFITLDDVQFPTPSFRPYFFDYDAERQANVRQLADEEEQKFEKKRQAKQLAEMRQEEAEATYWQGLIHRYLTAVINYCDQGHAKHFQQPIAAVIADMKATKYWRTEYSCLSDDSFFGWHRPLPVLLSMRHGRAVSYDENQTTYQILEAGTRQTVHGKQRGFAALYLWASYIFKVDLNKKQTEWRDKLVSEMKQSIDAGETLFRRYTVYDEAIKLLFPTMARKLDTPFGTDRSA